MGDAGIFLSTDPFASPRSKGPPSPFGEEDEIIGMKTSRTRTLNRVRYDDYFLGPHGGYPTDGVFPFHEYTGIPFLKCLFDILSTSPDD